MNTDDERIIDNNINNNGINNNGINNIPPKKKKSGGIINVIPYVFILAIIVVVGMLVFPKFFFGDETGTPTNNEEKPTDNPQPTPQPQPAPEPPKVSKYKIFDTTINKRPYAMSINNTPVAVKVQEGLNKAYIVYEIPTEGNTSRLLAVFRNPGDVNIGTMRSCRHNFMDYAHENDAILICFGWSHYAQDELNKGGTDFMNGNEGKWSSAFWRSNPEKLASEHTAYTSIGRIDNYTSSHGYRTTSDNSLLLNYSAEEINLNMEGAKTANTVKLPYGNITTIFKYDANTKMYTRTVNGSVAKDHKTKEPFTTKNIIITKVPYNVMPDNYYWNIKNTGSGKGYYITNGKYIPITWKKDSRNAQSKYYYPDGNEIQVNDGRTYIEVHVTSKSVNIS